MSSHFKTRRIEAFSFVVSLIARSDSSQLLARPAPARSETRLATASKMLISASMVLSISFLLSPSELFDGRQSNLLPSSVLNVRERLQEFFATAVPMFLLLFFESTIVEVDKVPGD